ncbi:MAG: M48 family metalloprotease [Gammaproteobacteria bacterium]
MQVTRNPRMLVLFFLIVLPAVECPWAQQRGKIRGFITARSEPGTLMIMDDAIRLRTGVQLEIQDGPSGKQLSDADLTVGTVIEAEGVWAGKHQFTAEKIKCDWDQFDQQIRDHAYLDREPERPEDLGPGRKSQLKVDGEHLVMDENSRREWQGLSQPVAPEALASLPWLGRQIRYSGVRQPDGTMAVRNLEIGLFAPADAYEIPGKRKLVRAQDSKTGIDILEFRKDKRVEGRFKLFPVRQVQEYVSALGMRLIPPAAKQPPMSGIEFRFYVVEDATANASALPDGAIMVNTGLLGLIENEAQLAFVLSHEVAHVLQAHYWRHVNETRTKRVLITIAAVAGSAYIGDVALVLGQLGMAAVVNGLSRRLENQADRLALQNVVDQGYDAAQAIKFFRLMVARYSDRTTSALWSNHDSSVMRGSFLTVQIARRYPKQESGKGIVDTDAFRAMRDAMGPVKTL